MNEDFEFDPYQEFLASGNRQDRQITGDDTEEDWYSWEAEEAPFFSNPHIATVHVYGEGIADQYWTVTWERVG